MRNIIKYYGFTRAVKYAGIRATHLVAQDVRKWLTRVGPLTDWIDTMTKSKGILLALATASILFAATRLGLQRRRSANDQVKFDDEALRRQTYGDALRAAVSGRPHAAHPNLAGTGFNALRRMQDNIPTEPDVTPPNED